MSGKVFLVGAGPGDAGLLTLRAAELIRSADVVVFDALVGAGIMEMIPPHVEQIDAGKRARAHTLPQERTNQLLVDKAREGKRVVRLKGGDPFVFGRGGEEAEELRAAGIGFEIVPGISSAIAGPGYAGIPVTHRDHASSVSLITGHESEDSPGVRWDTFAGSDGTLVFLMGMKNLPLIARELTARGMSGNVPVAVISRATTPHQRTVIGTLADIEQKVSEAGLPTPALIVVGSVVTLREKVSWFENRPLFGRTVVVTRAREQASDLKRLLEEAGANVLQFPTIEITPPDSWDSMDLLIDQLESFHWVIFTSGNGVSGFFHRLFEKGKDVRSLAGAKIAAVGDSTAAALRQRGIVPDLVPDRFQSAALLPLLPENHEGVRTAIVRAASGRNELNEELTRRGGTVHLAIAYQTKATDQRIDELRVLVAAKRIDCVTFTSGSTAENFFAKLSEEERAAVRNGVCLASIGPSTSQAIRDQNAVPTIEAPNASVEALAAAVTDYFRPR